MSEYMNSGSVPPVGGQSFRGDSGQKRRRNRGTVIIVVVALGILAALILGGVATGNVGSSKHDIADNTASIAHLNKSDAQQATRLNTIEARANGNTDRIDTLENQHDDKADAIAALEASQDVQDGKIADLENGLESVEDSVEANTERFESVHAKIDALEEENDDQNGRLSNLENIQDGHKEQLHEHDGRLDDLEHAIAHHGHDSSSDSDSESSSSSSSRFSTSFTSSSDFICDRAHVCPDAIDRPQDCMKWECTTGYPGGPGRCQEVRVEGCNLAEARTDLLNKFRSATFPAWSTRDIENAMPRHGNNYADFPEFSISLVKFEADGNISNGEEYFGITTAHQFLSPLDSINVKDPAHLIVENAEVLSHVSLDTLQFVENIDPSVATFIPSDTWAYAVAEPYNGPDDDLVALDIYAARKPLHRFALVGTSTRLQIWDVSDPREPVFVQLVDRANRENTRGSWSDVKTYDVTEFRVIMNGCDTRSIVTPGKFVQLRNGKVVRVITAEHLEDDEYFVRVRTLDIVQAGDQLPTVDYEIVDVVKHAYAYVVHETTACSTSQVVDLSGLGPGGSGQAEIVFEFGGCDEEENPLHEPLAIGNTNFNYVGSHNVYVDHVQGTLWFPGGRVNDGDGVRRVLIAADLRANPAAPPISGFVEYEFDVHDYVVAAYTCDEQRSVLRIPHQVPCVEPLLFLGISSNVDSGMALVNVTDPANIIELQTGVEAREGASNSLQHQAWFTSDKQYIIVGDEDQRKDPRYWSRTGVFSVAWHHDGLELREVQQLQSGSIVRNHNGYVYSNRKVIPQSLSTANPMQKDDYIDWYYNAQPFEDVIFAANYANGVEMYRLTYRNEIENPTGDHTHSHGATHGGRPVETWSEPFTVEFLGSVDTIPELEIFEYIGAWSTYGYGEEFIPALEQVHIINGAPGMTHFKYNEGFVQRELHSSVFDHRSIKLMAGAKLQKRHPGKPSDEDVASGDIKPGKGGLDYYRYKFFETLDDVGKDRLLRHAAAVASPLQVLTINIPTADGTDYLPVTLNPIFQDNEYDLIVYRASFGEIGPERLSIPTLIIDPATANIALQNELYSATEDHQWAIVSAKLAAVARSSEHEWVMYQKVGYRNSSSYQNVIERERRGEHLVQGPFGQGSCGTQLVTGDGEFSIGIIRDKSVSSNNNVDGAESSIVGVINGEVINNLIQKRGLEGSETATIPSGTSVIGTLNSRMAGIVEDDTEQVHVAYISPLTNKFYGHVIEMGYIFPSGAPPFSDGPLEGYSIQYTGVMSGFFVAQSASYSPPRRVSERYEIEEGFGGFATGGWSGVSEFTAVSGNPVNDQPLLYQPNIGNCGSSGGTPSFFATGCNGYNIAYTYTITVRVENGNAVRIGEELFGDDLLSAPGLVENFGGIFGIQSPRVPGPRVVVVDIISQSGDEMELEVMSVARYSQGTQQYIADSVINPYGELCNRGDSFTYLLVGFFIPVCATHPPKQTDSLTADVSGAVVTVIDAGNPRERIVREFLPSFVTIREEYFPSLTAIVDEDTGELVFGTVYNTTMDDASFISLYSGDLITAVFNVLVAGAENRFPSDDSGALQDSFPWTFSPLDAETISGGKLGVRAARRTIAKSSTLRVEEVYSHVEDIQGAGNEMQIEDVILALNGVSVTRDNYWVELAKYKYGEQISVMVFRDGEEVELERTLVVDTDDQFSTV